MLIVYRPEGATPRSWPFKPEKLMSPEVEAIERQTGLTFNQWVTAVGETSFVALHGLLYVMLKRTNPQLKWDEVQFCLADIDFEFEKEEAGEMLKVLMTKAETEELDDSELEIKSRIEELLGETGEDPKAEAASDEPPTDDTK